MGDPAVELFSVLCEMFGLILLGFIVFRAKLLKADDMKGFSWFTARIALPVMLFGSVARMSTNFNVRVIVLVFVVKFVVSLLTYIPTLFLVRGPTRWLTAASYMAATYASNDAVFGFPLVMALYPQYMSVFVGILACNPFYQTFNIIAWEIGASKRDKAEKMLDDGSLNESFADSVSSTDGAQPPSKPQRSLWRKVVFNVASNPIVIMTTFGLIYRFVPPLTWTLVLNDSHKLQLPRGLNEIVNSLTGAFSPLLLFQMGEVIEKNAQGQKKSGGLSVTILLTAIKLIVTPALLLLLIKPITGATGKELASLEEFLLLYGLFPSSEAVLVFSKMYGFVTAECTSVLLVTIILSAPLMLFASVYLKQLPDQEWATAHSDMVFMMNWVSLAFLLYVFASYILMWRSWSSFPMLNPFILAVVLLVFFVVQQINLHCNIVLYVVSVGLRHSVDLILLAFAIAHSIHKRISFAAMKRVAPWLMSAAVLLPWTFMLPMLAAQSPRKFGPLGVHCQKLFPAEYVINPILAGVCLLGALIALPISCGQQTSEVQRRISRRISEDIGVPDTAVLGEGVYLLVGVATITWLGKLVFILSSQRGSGGEFLEFIINSGYNILAVSLCLLPAMRGKVLERWKEIFSSPLRRSNSSAEDGDEHQDALQAEDVLALA